MTDTKEIAGFLDSEGRLVKFPSKRKKKLIALCYIADRIPEDRVYTEKEFNALLNGLHTFGDPASLRRELYDCFLIDRDPAGTAYKVSGKRPSAQELIEKYC